MVRQDVNYQRSPTLPSLANLTAFYGPHWEGCDHGGGVWRHRVGDGDWYYVACCVCFLDAVFLFVFGGMTDWMMWESRNTKVVDVTLVAGVEVMLPGQFTVTHLRHRFST